MYLIFLLLSTKILNKCHFYAKTPRSMIFCKEAMVSLYLALSKIKNLSLFSCKYIVKPQVVDILVRF